MSQSFIQVQAPMSIAAATSPANTPPQQLLFQPNLPSWLIPIFGSAIVLVMVNAWPNLFYIPTVVILSGIIFLWLTQPHQ